MIHNQLDVLGIAVSDSSIEAMRERSRQIKNKTEDQFWERCESFKADYCQSYGEAKTLADHDAMWEAFILSEKKRDKQDPE